jgi:selenide, water dikinase
VGLAGPDDAAVWRISDDVAVVQTLDFFPPVVDDPYVFGAVAAANAMSDVYAMGGEVLLALNVVAFPQALDKAVLAHILQGGADKVKEAGGIVAGGHTVVDSEPKYGLCVTGIVDPRRLMTKAGAKPGDILFLTKPLGTGVITTALKQKKAKETWVRGAVRSMLALNRTASKLAVRYRVRSATDITGFGLLGHAHEMAEAGHVRLVIRSESLPLLPGARECAEMGCLPGGGKRNRSHLLPEGKPPRVHLPSSVSQAIADLCFDPETSGGLLLAVPKNRAEALKRSFARAHAPLWEIGFVARGQGLQVV